MGKYTKKRNWHKNKSMKKMKKGGNDDGKGKGNGDGDVNSNDSDFRQLKSDDSRGAEQVAPSGSTTVEQKPSSWLSWFYPKKPDSTNIGGRKNKNRKNKSKSKK